MTSNRPTAAAGSRATRSIRRNLLPWLLAVAVTAVSGSLIQSHLNLLNLMQMGSYATWQDWQRTVIHDLGAFMPFYAALVGAAFLVAFPVALRLSRRWPAGRSSLFVLAGALGLAATFFIADVVAPIPTLIAGTRSMLGYCAMIASGMLGALVFEQLLGRSITQRRRSITYAYFAFPIMILIGAFSLHVAMRPERTEPFDDFPADQYRVATLVDGLDHPWAMVRLPDQRLLVTERPGRIRVIDADGALLSRSIEGLPEILQGVQGGLMDIELSPSHERDQLLFITYACGTPEQNNLCVGRGRLEGFRIEDFVRLFRAEPLKNTTVQFGSRIAFLPDRTLLVSIGDGFDFREDAQDKNNHIGTIVRLNMDGTIPQDNPFIGVSDARPALYSYGHRNPQGLHFDATTSAVYASEHGPYGGDEVNQIEAGQNYGWPMATEGINYPGSNITPHQELDGIEAPLTHWTPSIAPSGITVYRGQAFPAFEGDLLIAALAGKAVFRLQLDNGNVVSQQRLFHELDQRIRDVVVGEEGELYLLTDHSPGALLRIDSVATPE